jgi:colanic acid/amylovoran biosynthesis protein
MLRAIIEQVRAADQEAVLVVDPAVSPYDWRATHGFRQLFDSRQMGVLGPLRQMSLHAGYRKRFGLMRPEEIDVVLDASGFAFGDEWKPECVEGSASCFERYRRLGATIVLLPQAFGPFTSARIREATRRILAAAHLVFARDQESLQHCRDIVGKNAPLRRAPDFTNVLKGRVPADWARDPAHVAVVPNRQMLAHGKEASRRGYLRLLTEAIRRVASAGYRPFVLVHEERDREIADQLAREARVTEPVAQSADPLELKGILGACAFSIGSRFHGLVSALSQGVPCLGTSWSHKYRELFDDYGITPWVECWNEGEDAWLGRLDELTNPAARASVRQRILARSLQLQDETGRTWIAVAELLKQRRPPRHTAAVLVTSMSGDTL